MKKYYLSACVTVSAYTEVDAETREEALEIANGRDVAIGGNGTGVFADEFWVIEDADGVPMEITINDEDEL